MAQGELSLVVEQGKIEVRNFDEMQQWLEDTLKPYINLMITPNEYQDAKKTLAELRKRKKALNDYRIAKEKEYMTPWMNAKSQIDTLIKQFDTAITNIDPQVKQIEENKDNAKREKIKALWESKHYGFLFYDKVFNEKWLNASYTPDMVEREMDALIDKANTDYKTIESILNDKDQINEAWTIYQQTLDLGYSITEQKARYQARKQLEQAKSLENKESVANGSKSGKQYKVSFEIIGNVDEVMSVSEFMKQNNIKYTVLGKEEIE